MIHPLGHRLLKAAGRTPPGLAIDSHSFGLNTADEEEHGVFSKFGTDQSYKETAEKPGSKKLVENVHMQGFRNSEE